MVGVFVFASAVGGYVLVLSNLILDRSPPRTAHDGISSLPRACAGPRCFAVLCICCVLLPILSPARRPWWSVPLTFRVLVLALALVLILFVFCAPFPACIRVMIHA